MSITLPLFGIEAPSGSTPLRQLGPELEAFGRSIEEVLSTFDYSGADPNLVLSTVNQLSQWMKYGSATASTDAERSARFPAPTQGNLIYRLDKGWWESYYGLYNATTNPTGATPAGWYPVAGAVPEANAKRSDNVQAVSMNAWKVYNDASTWISGARVGFAEFDGSWLIPVTGRYHLDFALSTDNPLLFGGISLDSTTTGRPSLEIESTTGQSAFSIPRLTLSGIVEYTAGQRVYFKAVGQGTAGNLARSSIAKDAGHFNLRYLGPKRG